MLKTISKYLFIFLVFVIGWISCSPNEPKAASIAQPTIEKMPDKLLRHVVLFKFKEDADSAGIRAVEKAFSDLPNKIPQIYSYEWGVNNSPEGLDKGFTHCFFVTFKSEEDRAVYLPHPDHLAFVEVLKPVLDDVLVLDYWTK